MSLCTRSLAIAAALLHFASLTHGQAQDLMRYESRVKCGDSNFSQFEILNSYTMGDKRNGRSFGGRTRCGLAGNVHTLLPLLDENYQPVHGCYLVYDESEHIVDFVHSTTSRSFIPCYVSEQNSCPGSQTRRRLLAFAVPTAVDPHTLVSMTTHDRQFSRGLGNNLYVVEENKWYDIGAGPVFGSPNTDQVSYYQGDF
ncbi:CSEP0384 putative effector protein [Blumeria hordei DH14]|uniref:CSEP0384 putative effector protein n=1 Tax=Blumeria graminis f. sp. hordei (strain DH14) TaxID=546991 RepID=N1JHE0_BLUG1|nr:CSEP0384 putative effector protein [Blumeria hordei DH14]